jgi:arginyl-tRNA synthetase
LILKKRILFNPEESVDSAGNTGPFIQYTQEYSLLFEKQNLIFGNWNGNTTRKRERIVETNRVIS